MVQFKWHPQQNDNTQDNESTDESIQEKISNQNWVELIKELNQMHATTSFVDEFHIPVFMSCL